LAQALEMRVLFAVASATFLEPAPAAPETSDFTFDPICSWAQAIFVAGCDQQYPDHTTGCAMGVVTGKPLSSKGLETSVYCLTNNQPFVHFGNPTCNYNSATGGDITVDFNCQWLVQPAGIGAAIAFVFLAGCCLVCLCRKCCGGQRTIYVYR